MTLRTVLAALILTSAVFGQQDVPARQDPKPDVQAPAKQEPAKQEPNAGDIIAELQREKDRLNREIAYAKSRAANANRVLSEKLTRQALEIPAIDAGTNQPAPMVNSQMKKARVMTESELAIAPDNLMMTIDGIALQQQEYDGLMEYLRSLPNSGTDDVRAQRVLFELIRVKSVRAAFSGNAAEARVAEIKGQLENGTPIDELAGSVGTVLGAKDGGKVDVTRNSFLGTGFEQIAFALEEGERSRPFRTVFGFVIFQAEAITKGTEPSLDKVTGTAVQVKYVGDEQQLNLAQAKASRGQVEIIVRDESVMNLLPALYRPAGAQPMSALDTLRTQLNSVNQAIARLAEAGSDNKEAMIQLEALEAQKAKLEQALLNQAAPGVDTGDVIMPGRLIPSADLPQAGDLAEKPGKPPVIKPPVKAPVKKPIKAPVKKQ